MTKTTTTKATTTKNVKQYGNGISLDLLSAIATVVHTLSEGICTVVFCKHFREGERKKWREKERKRERKREKNYTRSTINFSDNRPFVEYAISSII